MKEYLRQNGLLKLSTFIIAMAIPVAFVIWYIVFLVSWSTETGFKLNNAIHFIMLVLIFFFVGPKDFFKKPFTGLFEAKHIVMATTLFLVGDIALEARLLNLAVFYFTLTRFNKCPYWQYEITQKDFSAAEVLAAVKKEFFLTKIVETPQGFSIKGFGLLAAQITVTKEKECILFRSYPLPSGFVFALALKVLPIPFGELYVQKVLKNLGISVEEKKIDKST